MSTQNVSLAGGDNSQLGNSVLDTASTATSPTSLDGQIEAILNDMLEKRLAKLQAQSSTMNKELAEIKKDVTLLRKPLV